MWDEEQGNKMKLTSISGAAALALGAALAMAPMQAMAAGAYHAPPAPVFRAPPPAPVYIAPRIATPGVTVRPTVTTPGVKPAVGVAKPVIARPVVGTSPAPVVRRRVPVTPVIITTTTTTAAPAAPAAKCTPKQMEVLARCKKP
jgi:hypothetical protein